MAQLQAGAGTQYQLSASNADLSDPSISFGSHLSVSVSTSLWENLFVDPRRPAVLGFVASVMAAAIPFFGAGYLLPTPGRETIYSLSARAHHLTRVQTLVTTKKWNRGLLNSRREAHGTPLERLHLIGFDYALLSSALLAALVGCALAAAEEGYCGLNLHDPVEAMRRWSWGLDRTTGRLPVTALRIDGRQQTLPEYMRELATQLLAMGEDQECLRNPPPESRAWGRGRLIKRFAPHIGAIDWSHIDLCRDRPNFFRGNTRINLPQLDSFNQRQFQPILDAASNVEGLLGLLENESSRMAGAGMARESS